MNRPNNTPSATSENEAQDSSVIVPGVDRAELTAWLSSLESDVTPPLNAQRIGVGQSNLTYVLNDAGGRR